VPGPFNTVAAASIHSATVNFLAVVARLAPDRRRLTFQEHFGPIPRTVQEFLSFTPVKSQVIEIAAAVVSQSSPSSSPSWLSVHEIVIVFIIINFIVLVIGRGQHSS
jgi:hypothetical protein